MDATELAYGLAGLVVGAGFALALLRRPRVVAPPKPADATPLKLTTTWRISELDKPTVVARDVEVDVPAGAIVLTAGQVDAAVFAVANVRQVPDVTAEYALDGARTKALLFLGGVRRGASALITTDRDLVDRLDSDARSLATAAEPYLERHRLSQLTGRTGLDVQTEGTVQDVMPHQGQFLLRLEDGGQILGVHVEKDPSELKGARIQVRGRLAKDKSGYPVLQANDVRRIQ